MPVGGTITWRWVGFEAALSLRSLGVRQYWIYKSSPVLTMIHQILIISSPKKTLRTFSKAGHGYIGGKTARNTFELWRSTLTEEQLTAA